MGSGGLVPKGRRGHDPITRARILARAFELREQDWTLLQISKELGVSVGFLSVELRKMILELMPADAVETVRNRQLNDLDNILRKLRVVEDLNIAAGDLATQAQDPEVMLKAANAVRVSLESRLKVHERMSKLTGADLPVLVEHKHTITTTMDAEIEDLLATAVGGGMLQSNPDEILED
jgi:hypothetical protein